jgi:hypothetical protein
VKRTRHWWLIHYQKYLIVDGKLVKKKVWEKLTSVVPERDGCMLIPPGLVLAAQQEYMKGVNEANRMAVATVAQKEKKINGIGY